MLRTTLFSLVFLLSASQGCAEQKDVEDLAEQVVRPEKESSNTDLHQTSDYKPTIDHGEKLGFYIPSDPEDCYVELDKMLPAVIKQKLKSGSEEDTFDFFRSLGYWMLHHWGLSRDLSNRSHLAKWFEDRNIYDSTGMAILILESYWCHLNNKPTQIDSRIKVMLEDMKLMAEIYRQQAEIDNTKTYILYTTPHFEKPQETIEDLLRGKSVGQ